MYSSCVVNNLPAINAMILPHLFKTEKSRPDKMAALKFPPKQNGGEPTRLPMTNRLLAEGTAPDEAVNMEEKQNGGRPQPGEAQKTRPAHQSSIAGKKG